jgi:farnesyl diphosphate synthase/geranylgeranyl diphosphate synthase type II
MGKAVGADAKRLKATYPQLLGPDQAKTWVRRLVEAAVADVNPLGERAAPLQELARYLLVRRA